MCCHGVVINLYTILKLISIDRTEIATDFSLSFFVYFFGGINCLILFVWFELLLCFSGFWAHAVQVVLTKLVGYSHMMWLRRWLNCQYNVL